MWEWTYMDRHSNVTRLQLKTSAYQTCQHMYDEKSLFLNTFLIQNAKKSNLHVCFIHIYDNIFTQMWLAVQDSH